MKCCDSSNWFVADALLVGDVAGVEDAVRLAATAHHFDQGIRTREHRAVNELHATAIIAR